MEELFNELNIKFTAYNWNKNYPNSDRKAIADEIKSEIMKILSSQLEPLSYTAAVLAEYEDELPDYITDEDYKRMFPLSKVDIVRTFPYVVINGHKYYLKAV